MSAKPSKIIGTLTLGSLATIIKIVQRKKSMKLPDLAFGPELAVLELICRGLTTPREQQMFKELVKSDQQDAGELLEQALRHRMLPLLSFHAFELISGKLQGTVLRAIWFHLKEALELNRHKITIFRDETAKVVNALNDQDIRFVCTKGISFESTIYEGNGSRYMNDIDFMIAPKSRSCVIDMMYQLGYQMGQFDWQTGKINPYSRKDLITYQLNPDHIPIFVKSTDDPIIRHVDVDFSNSLTWTRSRFDVPVEDALAEIIYQPIHGFTDAQLPCFSPPFQFIFTILHLFREAWFERWVGWGKDVTLMKFGDVVRLWQTYQHSLMETELPQTLENFGIMDPVLWVLEHLDRTLHTNIVATLGMEGRVTEEWLASAYGPDRKLRKWKGTMRERLHCKDRRALFADMP